MHAFEDNNDCKPYSFSDKISHFDAICISEQNGALKFCIINIQIGCTYNSTLDSGQPSCESV